MLNEAHEPFLAEEAPGKALGLAYSTKTKGHLSHIALVGSFPPRRCGIATFTADMHATLMAAAPGVTCDVVAIAEPDGEDPDAAARYAIGQTEFDDYARVAERLNRDGVELVCVQHEFGIFGGDAGDYLLSFLDALTCPVVVTMHTVLEQPNDDQSRVMAAILRRASRVVVMAERGKRILMERYGAPEKQIAVIAHGAPDCPLVDPDTVKSRFGLEGREVLLTFGLLSPGKGIESVIRALPNIIEERPEALYVVLGATHPHLRRRDGETYRESLIALADELGVGDHVRFVNTYVEFEELIAFLSAADIYVTPYLNEAQITSGTLSYAVALGKPVVSTRYWHATELLSDDVGVLVDFNDTDAFATSITRLLSDKDVLEGYRQRAYARGRETIWSRAGSRYNSAFNAAYKQSQKSTPHRKVLVDRPDLRAVERMTDACGMFQHACHAVPDRDHGYCVDDNARALILMQRGRALGLRGAQADRLTATYAAFVQHAWNPDRGRFRNFMGYDRRWLEEEGSLDSFGRSLWSLGETAKHARDSDMADWAFGLASRAAPHVESITTIRSLAFSVLGLSALATARADAFRGDSVIRNMLVYASDAIYTAFQRGCRPGWTWFEPALAYDNARLPEALIVAGRARQRPDMRDAGFQALTWLCTMQTGVGGVFRPVGHESFFKNYANPTQFDQQPLEAVATIDACFAAFDASGDPKWEDEAARAYAWYFGRNDLGASLAAPNGGCYDGLRRCGVNRNQGAESILSLQLASCAMKLRERGRRLPSAR